MKKWGLISVCISCILNGPLPGKKKRKKETEKHYSTLHLSVPVFMLVQNQMQNIIAYFFFIGTQLNAIPDFHFHSQTLTAANIHSEKKRSRYRGSSMTL